MCSPKIKQIYTYIYIYTYIHMYIHIQTNTHTNIYIKFDIKKISLKSIYFLFGAKAHFVRGVFG